MGRNEVVKRLEEYRLLHASCESLSREMMAQRPDGPDYRKTQDALLRSWRRAQAVELALNALEPELQKVLRLRYLDPKRWSVAQLCQMLGISEATLYRRRNRALRAFELALLGAE